MLDKKTMTEAEICQNVITPALLKAGWPLTQLRREFFAPGPVVIARGKKPRRGKAAYVDYLLHHPSGQPLAVLEAKRNDHDLSHGMQQAIDYASRLDVPFAITSNGDGFLIRDCTGRTQPAERHLALDAFPTPGQLWQLYCEVRGLDETTRQLITQPWYEDIGGRQPRYYQRIAAQRTLEAIANGQRRMLLVMATGTGKTYTVFQIIWRLWKAGHIKRALFLVDRNALARQTHTGDFKPFGEALTRVRNRTAETAYEIYIALYQSVSGTEEEQNIYKQFSPGFFDLVVIDECHRGSARDDSAWRAILDYFEPAIHLGLTATPKETREVSTLTYFGEPIYTYSLRQGIEDGFLAPYKVVRVDLDRDLQGWRPEQDRTDDGGQLIEDRIYNQSDMDRTLILRRRNERVADYVADYMLATDPYGKTIVFCEDIDHADRMRSALQNAIEARLPAERGNHLFTASITGDDDSRLEDFVDPDTRFPVIATTSKLLSTGVDTQTCKLIVIDQTIRSMVEFKQTIGRGTRILEENGKLWFTIIDFKKATELFADPAFDGEPVIVLEPAEALAPDPEEPDAPEDLDEPPRPGRTRYRVGDVEVNVLAARVQYLGPDGKLITESLTTYTRDLIRRQYATLDHFLQHWTAAERKAAILDELRAQCVVFDELHAEVGRDLDPFDLVCHVAFDRPPLTRQQRAARVRKHDIFTRYGDQARAVLDALLDKYADEGIVPIEDPQILGIRPLDTLGTVVELFNHFGGPTGYSAAVRELEAALYAEAA